MTAARPPRKLDAVQVLRAFAALMVVVGHALAALESYPDRFGATEPVSWYAGGAGVDVFFVISGFIMVFASGRLAGRRAGAREFLLRRLIRIVPPYWAATGAMLLVLAVGPERLPTIAAAAASFAFVPFDTDGRGDGVALPVLDIGWTLNYEMMFYIVFALFLPLGRVRGVWSVAAVMALLFLVGAAVPATATAAHFWTRGIVLEFVAGMMVALAVLSGRMALPGSARIALVAATVVYYVVDPVGMMRWDMTPNDARRVLGWGVPATLLLVATVTGATSFTSLPGRIAMLLGDASYALYLAHPFVLIAMLQLPWLRVLPASVVPAMFATGTVALACLVAVVAHRWLERPAVAALTRALRRRGLVDGTVPMPADTSLRTPG